MEDDDPCQWSMESIASTISDLIQDAKAALIRMNGTVEDRGDVMSVLLLADLLARSVTCPRAKSTPERSPESPE